MGRSDERADVRIEFRDNYRSLKDGSPGRSSPLTSNRKGGTRAFLLFFPIFVSYSQHEPMKLRLMAVAALVGVGVMLIVDVLVGVDLPIVLVGMDVLISCMATHLLSPPSTALAQYILLDLTIKPFL